MPFHCLTFFITLAVAQEEQHHVILDERMSRTTLDKYMGRARIDSDSRLSDDLERALILRPGGELCGDKLLETMHEIFRRENVVVVFSHLHTIGKRTSVPSQNFLSHCQTIIQRKFSDPTFGGLSVVDINDSDKDPNLMFVASNYAIPVFVRTDVDGPPSNEVHLFVLEIVTFKDKEDFTDAELVVSTCEFFITQGGENDNTWVGIEDYGELDKEFLMPLGGEQSAESEESSYDQKKASTIVLDNQSSWASLQRLMDDTRHGFTYSLAYRFFEMVGIKDLTTGEISYVHAPNIQLGIPIQNTKT
jgi:hypothetical protein